MKYEQNPLLKDYTTLAIGGPARCMASPTTIEEMKEVLEDANRQNLRLFVLGNGSNVLFEDQGFDGLILHMADNWKGAELLDKNRVKVKSGTTNEELAKYLQEQGLGGYEFACGVPGTIGGAIMMNAGCYGGETKDVLESVEWLDKEGNLHVSSVEELDLGYRHSRFMDDFGLIVSGTYKLFDKDPDEIQKEMDDLQEKRWSKQPMDKHSCGSTFKRPEGYFAGTLIDQSGLRGFQLGNAMVSDKHCGFLINNGNCTAKEFLDLIRHVQDVVYEKHGVHLEPEVRLIPYKE